MAGGPETPQPSGYVPQKRFDEATAAATGAGAAALALLDPGLGIAAAGLAPLLANRLNELYAGRLTQALAGLKQRGLNLESALIDGPDSALKADILRDFLHANLETGSKEKVAFLLHLAEFGIKSNVRMETLFARRVIRTVARIDELEMIILASLARLDRSLEGVQLAVLAEHARISDADILGSGLAVLQSEGLVSQRSNAADAFRVSDYGESVLRHLREAISDSP